MKSLLKLIFPLSLSFLALNNSYSQKMLPEKFKNYDNKHKTLLDSSLFYSESLNRFFRMYFCDIDSDSICDAVEMYPIKVVDKKILKSKFPVIYFLDIDKDRGFEMFIDSKMDGLNGNEIIYTSDLKDDKKKTRTINL